MRLFTQIKTAISPADCRLDVEIRLGMIAIRMHSLSSVQEQKVREIFTNLPAEINIRKDIDTNDLMVEGSYNEGEKLIEYLNKMYNEPLLYDLANNIWSGTAAIEGATRSYSSDL